MNYRVRHIVILMLLIGSLNACASDSVPGDTQGSVVICKDFDIRCIPCEIEGEGALCRVEEEPGICRPMRIVVGPQVEIEGMRCRAQ